MNLSQSHDNRSHPSSQKPVVLVTGSGGLIGSRTIPKLREDFTVVGMDLHPPGDNDTAVDHWIQVDLTDDQSVAEAIKELCREHGDHLASVLHLAAYYDFSGEASPLYDKLTVQGTRRLIQQLQPLSVEQFIFSSSLLVMQSADIGERLTSKSPTNAEWAYPQSKLKTESMLRREHGNIPILNLRIAGVYDQQCHSLPISHQIQRIYEKQMESYFFPGNEDCGQSFIHLDDLADCLVAAIHRRGELPTFTTLLIGEEDVMSYEQLQDAIGQGLHGRDWPTIRIPACVAKSGAWIQDKMATSEEDRPFIKPWMVDLADQNYPVDLAEARQMLDWSPMHSLRQTLPAILENLKRDPKQFYETNKLGPLEDSKSGVSS
ncbi:NAD-dependent epimerase/dehydratase family protein [Blastopirellula marina]|uniref:NAD(P)-dependent oxidoreductase n=1 Tax=Blastopirellula marina TaxID=124 RepID=A0A2S8G9S6_9BACT|nr:NAD(P)-dependent oxidoreductase [Blastopirellula marina]PQO41208.1 NAD(P)-dependent oxidoreductase [Blastopirellula marina]PTL46084.1 NAD(P)-dependent oxidoreductase [Blastopirellula marina]